MKKIYVGLLLTGLMLTGCTTTPTNTVAENQPQPKQEQPQPVKSKYPFPKDAKATGKGKITSQNLLYVAPDTVLTQIGYDIENYNEQLLTFFFINDMFIESQQAGEMFSGTLELEGNNLKPGTYKITAVQYENNDPNKGKILEFHQATYKIEPTK
jgi:hypothetical protein